MIIDEEIQQTRWESSFQKAAVNILFTSRCLEEHVARAVKPRGITLPQFNILRILRGQKGNPASIKLLTERMVDKSSNASRLVDKLLAKDLVRRVTCPENRRAVEVTITDRGLELLEAIGSDSGRRKPAHPGFSESDALELSNLLDRMRESLSSTSPLAGESSPTRTTRKPRRTP